MMAPFFHLHHKWNRFCICSYKIDAIKAHQLEINQYVLCFGTAESQPCLMMTFLSISPTTTLRSYFPFPQNPPCVRSTCYRACQLAAQI